MSKMKRITYAECKEKMEKITFAECRENLKRFKINKYDDIHDGLMLPDAFYLNHSDYWTAFVSEKAQTNCFDDIRKCVLAYPKLIYPLLAVMSARFLPDTPSPCDMQFCHFYAPDPTVRKFIQNLTEAFYGMVGGGHTGITAQGNYAGELSQIKKAFCLERYFIPTPMEKAQLMEELLQSNTYGNRLTIGLYHSNMIITTSDTLYFPLYLSGNLRRNMVSFQTDLLDGTTDISLLRKFNANCASGKYHHVMNTFFSKVQLDTFEKAGKTVRYSRKLKRLMRKHPSLKVQAYAFLAAANAVRLLLGIPVSTREVERVLLNNFRLAQRSELALDILHLGSVYHPAEYPCCNVHLRTPVPGKKTWIAADLLIPVEWLPQTIQSSLWNAHISAVWPLGHAVTDKQVFGSLYRSGLLKKIHGKPCTCLQSIPSWTDGEDEEHTCYTLYLLDGDITAK